MKIKIKTTVSFLGRTGPEGESAVSTSSYPPSCLVSECARMRETLGKSRLEDNEAQTAEVDISSDDETASDDQNDCILVEKDPPKVVVLDQSSSDEEDNSKKKRDEREKRSGEESAKERVRERRSEEPQPRRKRLRLEDTVSREIIQKSSKSSISGTNRGVLRNEFHPRTGITPWLNINYGTNMFCPYVMPKTGLRMVVIDGSNVAVGHSKNRHFSTEGLEICIQYFLLRGHIVRSFVPLYRRTSHSTSSRALLEKLAFLGYVIFTPSRSLNGKNVTSYDDRFIVQCAAVSGAVIVSNDNYRDLMMENAFWRETIEKRLLMYTWVDDLLIFPSDPLGKNGPTLDELLRFD